MSNLFYDHLLNLDELERNIKQLFETHEERVEIWKVVDDTLHNTVMYCVLDKLPQEHHEEFLEKFHAYPHDCELLDYLREKMKEDVEEIIKTEVEKMKIDILRELKDQ